MPEITREQYPRILESGFQMGSNIYEIAKYFAFSQAQELLVYLVLESGQKLF